MNAATPTIGAGEELFRLYGGEARAIAGPLDDVVIHCASGAAWVTQAGVREDVVLEAGMSHRPRATGKIVIQGLFDAVEIAIEHGVGGNDACEKR